MKKIRSKGKFTKGNVNIEVDLVVLHFEEDKVHFIHSPHLDLTGYGKNLKEAEASFEVILEEYFRYTLSKKTLFKDLRAHGWDIKESSTKPKVTPPEFSTLISKNKELSRIMNSHDFSKQSRKVGIPLPA